MKEVKILSLITALILSFALLFIGCKSANSTSIPSVAQSATESISSSTEEASSLSSEDSSTTSESSTISDATISEESSVPVSQTSSSSSNVYSSQNVTPSSSTISSAQSSTVAPSSSTLASSQPPALTIPPFTVNDPENTRGLDTKTIGCYFGVSKDDLPNQMSIDNQTRLDGYANVEALALDTVSTDKGMYLTFDCGYEYNNLTAVILDTLKAKNVKAIFFCTLSY